MADEPEAPSSGGESDGKGSGIKALLNRKVFGKVPMWVVVAGLAALGGLLWYRHNQAAAANSAGTGATGAASTTGLSAGDAGLTGNPNGGSYWGGGSWRGLSGGTSPTSTGTPTAPAPAGDTFVRVSGAKSVAAALAQGETIYEQPGGPGTPYVAIPASAFSPSGEQLVSNGQGGEQANQAPKYVYVPAGTNTRV
jgi:hypothetical protein